MSKSSALKKSGTIKFLEEKVFRTNGCPKKIISDNGVQFKSKLFTDMIKKYGIVHQFTPKNHPQANPVESTNKSIKNALRAGLIDSKNHAGWDGILTDVKCNTSHIHELFAILLTTWEKLGTSRKPIRLSN